MPPHLKKSINLVHLENGTYERIVSHLERELELNSLEAPDELQKNTVTQQASQQNSEKSKPTCHNCNKPSHYRNQCRQLKREKDQIGINANSADNTNNNNGSAPKLNNVLNTWMTLESQPIMLGTSPGTFGQSSSAFAKQDWSWQLRNAILDSNRLNS